MEHGYLENLYNYQIFSFSMQKGAQHPIYV